MLRLSGKINLRGIALGKSFGPPLPLSKVSISKSLKLHQVPKRNASGQAPTRPEILGLKYLGASLAGFAVAAGGAVVYAKYNDGFRHQLETTMPYMSDVFTSLYGESTYTPDKNKDRQVQLDDGSMMRIQKFKLKEKEKEDSTIPKSEGAERKPSSSAVTVSSVDQSSVSVVDLDISSNRRSDSQRPTEAEVKKVEDSEDVPLTPARKEEIAPVDKVKPLVSEPTIQEAPSPIASPSVHKILEQPTTNEVKIKDEVSIADSQASQSQSSPNAQEISHVTSHSTDSTLDDAAFTDNSLSESDNTNPKSLEVLLQVSADKLRSLSESAMNHQKEAAASIRVYIDLLGKAITTQNTNPDYDAAWLAAAAAEQESQAKIDEAKLFESSVQEEVNRLEHVIRAVRKSGASKMADSASDLGARVYLDLERCADQVKHASAELGRMNDFHQLVGHAEEQLQNELKSIAPELQKMISDCRNNDEGRQGTASKALLAYSLKKSELLMRALEQQKIEEKVRLQQLLSSQQHESVTDLAAQLEAKTQALNKEALIEKEKLEAKLLSKYEAEIRHQLKRQAAAHRDHLGDVVRVQGEELKRRHEAETKRILQEQELDHQHDASTQLARLKAILASVDLLNDIERRQKKAEDLMLAVQALTAAIGKDIDNGKSRSLLPEILAISRVSDQNNDVAATLATIPRLAAEKGVITEDSLRERFDKVHTICRRVAMVDENGGSLWSYAMSCMRSFLTFDIDVADHVTDDVDPNNIDSYAVLAKARHCVKSGDWEQAVKFMSLLHGLPKQLATDWIQDAIMYLETKQATDFLTSYSLSIGQGPILSS